MQHAVSHASCKISHKIGHWARRSSFEHSAARTATGAQSTVPKLDDPAPCNCHQKQMAARRQLRIGTRHSVGRSSRCTAQSSPNLGSIRHRWGPRPGLLHWRRAQAPEPAPPCSNQATHGMYGCVATLLGSPRLPAGSAAPQTRLALLRRRRAAFW